MKCAPKNLPKRTNSASTIERTLAKSLMSAAIANAVSLRNVPCRCTSEFTAVRSRSAVRSVTLVSPAASTCGCIVAATQVPGRMRAICAARGSPDVIRCESTGVFILAKNPIPATSARNGLRLKTSLLYIAGRTVATVRSLVTSAARLSRRKQRYACTDVFTLEKNPITVTSVEKSLRPLTQCADISARIKPRLHKSLLQRAALQHTVLQSSQRQKKTKGNFRQLIIMFGYCRIPKL